MSASSVLRGASFVLLWIPFASQLFVLSGTYAAEKFTPEHPLVQEMVNKGMGFLNKSGQSNNAMYNGDHSQGTSILTGYTIYKVTSEVDHPLVVRAVGVARKLADESASVKTLTEESVIYTISLAGVLLATVDVEKHATQILRIRDYLLRNQKPNGGFGYATGSHAATGDISQTQYATLALWTMGQHNIEIPQEPMIRLINFMIGAQTQDGGFPYQSNGQPGGGSNDPTNSLCAAGLSALLIAGDGVGLYRNKLSESQDEEGIIPTAFKRVMDDAGKRAKVSIDRTRSDSASKRSEDWFANHPYTRAQWHYYYTYSKERYESFLEITKGKQNKSPDWYNNGVLGLRINQGPNGELGAEK